MIEVRKAGQPGTVSAISYLAGSKSKVANCFVNTDLYRSGYGKEERVDNLTVNLPQIIGAAAQSHLGILALLSIALSVLAYFFFSTSSEKVKVGIFALLFFGVTGFGVAMFWNSPISNKEVPGDAQPPLIADRNQISDGEVLQALKMVGVDFSVGEITLKEWLNNSDTLYPAISIELLKLLRGKRLVCPVYLDVVVYNYEQVADLVSPSRADTVDLARLKTALIMSYNTRYGMAVTDFDALIR